MCIFSNTELNKYQRMGRELMMSVEWSPDNATICLVFDAMFAQSLEKGKVEEIGRAMNGRSSDLKKSLTNLVRQKVLRTRIIKGVTHYELNY